MAENYTKALALLCICLFAIGVSRFLIMEIENYLPDREYKKALPFNHEVILELTAKAAIEERTELWIPFVGLEHHSLILKITDFFSDSADALQIDLFAEFSNEIIPMGDSPLWNTTIESDINSSVDLLDAGIYYLRFSILVLTFAEPNVSFHLQAYIINQ